MSLTIAALVTSGHGHGGYNVICTCQLEVTLIPLALVDHLARLVITECISKPSYYQHGLALLCPHFGLIVRYLGSHIFPPISCGLRITCNLISFNWIFDFSRHFESDTPLKCYHDETKSDVQTLNALAKLSGGPMMLFVLAICLILQPWNYRTSFC